MQTELKIQKNLIGELQKSSLNVIDLSSLGNGIPDLLITRCLSNPSSDEGDLSILLELKILKRGRKKVRDVFQPDQFTFYKKYLKKLDRICILFIHYPSLIYTIIRINSQSLPYITHRKDCFITDIINNSVSKSFTHIDDLIKYLEDII
jgi:biotin synthase-related radical SAM superfamily protein